MQELQALLAEHGDSPVNRANKLFHWLRVPPLVWGVVALLWSLPFPAALQTP